MFTLFRKKEKFSLPELSEKIGEVRATFGNLSPKQTIKILIDVAKVWTYDYKERAPFIQELFDLLPKKSQDILLDFIKKSLPNSDSDNDLPHAICKLEKEKLEEILLLVA